MACQANQEGRLAAPSVPGHGSVSPSPRLAHRPVLPTERVEGGISSQRLADCPPAYANVLRLLREAEASGAWPGTRLGLGLGSGLGLGLGSGLGVLSLTLPLTLSLTLTTKHLRSPECLGAVDRTLPVLRYGQG